MQLRYTKVEFQGNCKRYNYKRNTYNIEYNIKYNIEILKYNTNDPVGSVAIECALRHRQAGEVLRGLNSVN